MNNNCISKSKYLGLIVLFLLLFPGCRVHTSNTNNSSENTFLSETTPQFVSDVPSDGKWIRSLDGMTMILIPEGEFIMGAEGGENQPSHRVFLNDYWIDQTEVTNGMYALCVKDGVCQEPSQADSHTRESYYGNSTYADYPVIYVSWDQAQAYCHWVGARLPTEAEWEKAARGTDERQYPWGNEAPSNLLLNYGDQIGDTTPVGSYPSGASPYEVLDLSGNVWEWVADWFDGDYYTASPYKDPQGPDDGQLHVTRGGSWSQPEKYGLNTATWRAMALPEYTKDDLGFRCAFSQ